MCYFPSNLKNKSNLYQQNDFFQIGNVLSMFFRVSFMSFFFEGLCIALRKKRTPEFSFILRNIVGGVAVEFCISFFYNRSFFFKTSDFKKKSFRRSKAKIYYIKNKLGRESRVK